MYPRSLAFEHQYLGPAKLSLGLGADRHVPGKYILVHRIICRTRGIYQKWKKDPLGLGSVTPSDGNAQS